MNNWLNFIQLIFYPYTCFSCNAAGHNRLDLCGACLGDFIENKNSCDSCDAPLPKNINGTCGKCLKNPPHFDKAVGLYAYQGLPRFLIQSLKFNAKYSCARTIGLLIAARMKNQALMPSALIAVPLHPIRHRERGFNQSEKIAHYLQRELNIPLLHNACKRTINTTSQTHLKAHERKKNLNKAFSFTLDKPLDFVAVIDDVVTTGSTANEIAKTLKKAGVKRVEIWAFARA
ncbi:MAG: phosphoribosyltransferase [Cycloclasticus sp. symbiont of Poecilosclerida sp. M]|nr:MAG: phosphoribosyltransferase [Cycloclasticus sp. symbiont of Poecilosclerida sp. M]